MDLGSMMSAAAEYGENYSSIINIGSIASVVGLWMMFVKAGEAGWIAIIPFYNVYKLCEKVMDNPWYWVRLFTAVIPIVGWIFALYFDFQICKATALAYGKPKEWAWGYLFLGPIFYCITGFDKNISYYGPWGSGDSRTEQARGARTVDFDVVKNDEQSYSQPEETVTVEPVSEPSQTEDVEFTVDEVSE